MSLRTTTTSSMMRTAVFMAAAVLMLASSSWAFSVSPSLINTKNAFQLSSACASFVPKKLQQQASGRSHRLPAILRLAADARKHTVLDDEAAIGATIQKRGSTVKPLKALKDSGIDFSKVHLFFGNERVAGEPDKAFKCFEGAQDFVKAVGIPASQVHKHAAAEPQASCNDYEERMKKMVASGSLSTNPRTGLVSLDLVLLGSGSDGHCASLYPDQAEMVAKGLGTTTSNLPAGMIMAHPGTSVEWLLTKDSAALLKK